MFKHKLLKRQMGNSHCKIHKKIQLFFLVSIWKYMYLFYYLVSYFFIFVWYLRVPKGGSDDDDMCSLCFVCSRLA